MTRDELYSRLDEDENLTDAERREIYFDLVDECDHDFNPSTQ